MTYEVKPHLRIFLFVFFHALFPWFLLCCGYLLFLDLVQCMGCEREDSGLAVSSYKDTRSQDLDVIKEQDWSQEPSDDSTTSGLIGVIFEGSQYGGTLRQLRLKSVTRFEVKRQLQVCASIEKVVSTLPIQRSKERVQHWVPCYWLNWGQDSLYYGCLWNWNSFSVSCGVA